MIMKKDYYKSKQKIIVSSLGGVINKGDLLDKNTHTDKLHKDGYLCVNKANEKPKEKESKPEQKTGKEYNTKVIKDKPKK